MLKQAWMATLVAAALTTAASARSLEVRYWPVTFTPEKLLTIPVVMDVGLWMDIRIQGDAIKLHQVDARRFEGCIDVRVRSNFNARLLYSIASTGAVGGWFTTLPEYADVKVPGGMVTVCARLTEADFSNVPGGSRDLQVANITVEVIPRP